MTRGFADIASVALLVVVLLFGLALFGARFGQ